MPMRLSGLMSGMDTDSIIQELVAAKRTKVDTAKKAQTKLEWKQEAWKDLNTKLKNLQSKYLNNMRFVSSYSKRVTKVSNSSAVSVLTGEDAMNGVQDLEIRQLAKKGYLTGAKISGKDGSELTALSKMSDILDGFSGEGSISVKSGGNTVDIRITGDTTISDVLTQLKNAGLNASFDAKNQRFFVNAKDSGAANDFSITASDENGAKALSALGLQVNLNDDKAALQEYQRFAAYYDAGDREKTLENMSDLIGKSVDARVQSYLDQYKNLQASLKDAQSKVDELTKKYEGRELRSAEDYQADIDSKNEEIKKLEESLKATDSPLNEEEKAQAQEKLDGLKKEVEELKTLKSDAQALASGQNTVSSLKEQIAGVEEYVTISQETAADGSVTYSAAAKEKLTGEIEDSYYKKAQYAAQVMDSYNPGDASQTGATKVNGQDAVIYLNGAEFTNNTNVFEINGLTFTALSETKEGESITVTTQDDTDGIYNMIKDFLKEYNAIINEMDKLYNAESAKGYEPLTNEEKEAMSKGDVEEWEKKVKDALLRRDENLSSISSALRGIMAGGISVNGKTMYLSDFGINTLGYFEAADNERNAYHIDGDEDDAMVSGNADKLRSMISSDPETVISFFSQLSKDLYGKMSDLSKSVEGYRSYGSFFDDKKMKADYNDYTSKIKDLEKKLADYEDKWYAKFSKMETAMAKMQSNMSAVTSLLGG